MNSITKPGFNNVDAWGADNQALKAGWQKYLRYFYGLSPILDVGCARGTFLELLQENNIPCIGIDVDPDMISYCQRKDFKEVYLSNAVTFLKDKQCCYGGIFCSHIIEHMWPKEVIAFIKMSFNALKPGGRLVLITPNPRNWSVISHTFWLDTTHVRPYPLLLLEKLLTANGFRVIDKGRGPQIIVPKGFIKQMTITLRMHLRKIITTFRRCILGGMFYDMDYIELGHQIIIVGEKPKT